MRANALNARDQKLTQLRLGVRNRNRNRYPSCWLHRRETILLLCEKKNMDYEQGNVSPGSSTPGGIKRKPRVALACEQCRARKIRCDGETPCSGCRHSGASCTYRNPRHDRKQAARRVSRQQPMLIPSTDNVGSSLDATAAPTPEAPRIDAAPPRLLNDPVHYKRQRELRAGIGVSNKDTGSFQFYGK